MEVVLLAKALCLGDDRMHVAGGPGIVLDVERLAIGLRRLGGRPTGEPCCHCSGKPRLGELISADHGGLLPTKPCARSFRRVPPTTPAAQSLASPLSSGRRPGCWVAT